jgi:hypothetical protein
MDEKDRPSDTFHCESCLPDGSILGTRRRGNDESGAIFKPLKDGSPITEDQEIVRVSPGRTTCELIVESLRPAKGPAKFTTKSYRRNYDGIFGARPNQAIC